MSKLIWIALFGLALAGCASDQRSNSGSSASGRSASGATTPSGNEAMRGSNDVSPGAEGEREKPAGSPAPRSTY